MSKTILERFEKFLLKIFGRGDISKVYTTIGGAPPDAIRPNVGSNTDIMPYYSNKLELST